MAVKTCATSMRHLTSLDTSKETYAPPAPPAPPFLTHFVETHNHMILLAYSRICPIGCIASCYSGQNVWEKVAQVAHFDVEQHTQRLFA